tara:strand:- start:309 stop:527 length:219 start_codon:yes stop_codon:yes gene_type:complete
MKDNLKMYYQIHQYLLKRYDAHQFSTALADMKEELELDRHLVDTHRDNRSGDEQTRCDLEEELYKNKGRYDG